jgi:antitoxin YefM
MYILMYMRYFSVAEARAKFASILALSTKGEDRVVITKNGEPTAILLSIDEYESMTETIEIMSDPDLYAEILAFQKNPNDQETYTSEEVLAALEARVKRSSGAGSQKQGND